MAKICERENQRMGLKESKKWKGAKIWSYGKVLGQGPKK